ncbi:MAG: hypothetical protein WC781_02985 [Candidatus Pacearchaeota archaeon]|jgi:hypothetical protein
MAQPIGVILQQWADLDIFYYALPFLLIFALVFAILEKVKIMGKEADNRGISAVIAIAVGLMALQFDSVPRFFQIIFPKLGIALSILLVGLILMGLFMDYTKHQGAAYIFLAFGGVATLVIILNSFEEYSWWGGGFWQENMSAIVAGIIIVIFILVVITSGHHRASGEKAWMFKEI